MKPPAQLELKLKWSLTELAKAMGLLHPSGRPNKRAVQRDLKTNGVPLRDSKGKRSAHYVYLIDIQRNWPEAWLSILRIAELKRAEVRPVSVGQHPQR